MSSIAKTSIVIGGTTKELDAAVDRAAAKLRGLAVSVAGLFAGAATVSWGYDLLKQGEAAEIAFTQMLGSADVAKQTLKELADYAAKTPFDNPTLVKAYRNLLNFKFAAQDIPAILRVLGDTAAAMPEGMTEGMNKLTIIMGQMKSKAKLSSQEMMQLTEAGVNAWEYLRKGLQLGTVAEAVAKVESGAVDSLTGVRSVLKGMETDFGGIGEKMSKTVEGLMSTITDNAGRGLQAIFKGATGGEFKKWLADLGDGLNSLGDIGESIGQKIAAGFQVVKNVFDGIHAVGSAIADVIAAAFGVDSLSSFLTGLGDIRTDFGLVKAIAMSFLEGLAGGFAIIGDAVSRFLFDPMQYVFGVLTKIFGAIVDGVGYVLDGLGYISDTAAELATKVHETAKGISDIGQGLKDRAVTDMNAGNVMSDKVRAFFADTNAKNSPSKEAKYEQFVQDFLDELDKSVTPKMLDFNKSIDKATSLLPVMGKEMSALATQAATERNDRANEVLRNAKSPGDVFREELKDLERMLAEGLIGKDAFSDAVGKKFRGLGDKKAEYSPNSAILAGSAEAQQTIMEAKFGRTRVEDVLKSIDEEAKATRKANEQILKELQKQKLVTVGI